MRRPARGSSWVVVVLLMVVACYTWIWIVAKPAIFHGVQADFSCFYRAGKMLRMGDGRQIYDLPVERRYDAELGTGFRTPGGQKFSLPFVFPPFTLLLFAPLSLLPYRAAETVWYILNVGALLALPFLLRRKLAWGRNTVGFALLAPALFVPAALALMQGQASILLLLVFALVFAELRLGNDAMAGCLLAVASIKPQLVIPMLLALVALRRWRALVACALGCSTLLGLSAGLIGWKTTLGYPAALLQFNTLSPGLGGEHALDMPNLRGTLTCLLQSQMSSAAIERITLVGSALLLLVMMAVLRRQRQLTAANVSLVIVVTLMVSYHAYLHDCSLLLLPCLLLGEMSGQEHGSAIQTCAAVTMLSLFVIPLAPTSLHATAMQMFAAMAVLAFLFSFEIAVSSTQPRKSADRNLVYVGGVSPARSSS